MAAVGGAFTVLTIGSLLLPSVIGTHSEVRQCAFSERLQGASVSKTGASRDNSTVHCSRGHACFGLWEQQPGGDVLLLKQGCWTSQPDCLSDHCLVSAPPAYIHKGSYRFCCCSQDLCNRDFREVPVTPAAPVRQHTDGSLTGQLSALVAVGTVAGVLILVSLLSCGYRLLTGKKKLSLVTLNVPKTSNASCVDMDELKLWELIGGGRYSCVYRGTLSERSVAVKVFSSAHHHRYINERSTYSLLSLRQQPNIAHFLCADEKLDSEGCTQVLIVMDHYPHGCLSHFLSRSSVDWTSCCRMMLGVTRGLSFLHSELVAGDESKPALAHRDVSSSNVLVRSDLSCVLADFSLSMKLTREPSHLHGDGDSVTISEVGTLRYLAPELLAGALDLHEYGTALKQVDVYALGLLFWESFRRCHDLFPGRAGPHFQLAFQMELGQEPSLEDMHMLVVRDKCRPRFPAEWKDNSSVLRLLKETMEDCWDQDAEARLSAQCAEERLCQLSLLTVPTQLTHSEQSDWCRPPAESSSSGADVVAVDLWTSSRVERCSTEDNSQTAAGGAFCFTPQLTGGAVPVSVCLPLDQPQVLPQRPSSLQLRSAASSRDRQGPQRTGRPRERQVETGVAKMNAVAVLAQAPVSVTMATNRRVVQMSDGSSAGVPTLMTNHLMAQGVTNRAGPQEEGPCSSSVRGVVQQSMTDQEPGLNFLWSPDEQQPLLWNEVPLAGAFLSAQRSNINNNNSNIHSWRAQKTGSSDGMHPEESSLSSTTAPAKKLSSHPVHPSEDISITKTDTQVTLESLNVAASGVEYAQWSGPSVHARELKSSHGDEMQWSRCKSPGAAGIFEHSFVEPAERCCNMDIISPQVCEDTLHASGIKNEDVFRSPSSALSCSLPPAPVSHTSPDLSPVSPEHTPCSAPGVLFTNENMSSAQSTAGADRDRCLPRPCSLDLSSSSALIGGAPHNDSGLSVSGEKIRCRVKTPYTLKKWRPLSWAPPADQPSGLPLHDTSNCFRIIQSKSSMAMFHGDGATSQPDGLTSF